MTTYVPPCSLRFSRCLTYLLSHTRDIHVQLPHLPGMRSTRPFLRLSSAFGHGRAGSWRSSTCGIHHIIAGCPNHHQISPKKSPDKRGVSHAVGDGSAAELACSLSSVLPFLPWVQSPCRSPVSPPCFGQLPVRCLPMMCRAGCCCCCCGSCGVRRAHTAQPRIAPPCAALHPLSHARASCTIRPPPCTRKGGGSACADADPRASWCWCG